MSKSKPVAGIPHWPDDCLHAEKGGIFVATVVSPHGDIWDIWLWNGEFDWNPSVCIRYGERERYISCFGAALDWIDPKRTVATIYGTVQLASEIEGVAMDAIRVYLDQHPDIKEKVEKRQKLS